MSEKFTGDAQIRDIRRGTLTMRNYALRVTTELFMTELWTYVQCDPFYPDRIKDHIEIGWEIHKMMLQSESPDSHDLYNALKHAEYDFIVRKNRIKK